MYFGPTPARLPRAPARWSGGKTGGRNVTEAADGIRGMGFMECRAVSEAKSAIAGCPTEAKADTWILEIKREHFDL